MHKDEYKLAIIVPCYNEFSRFPFAEYDKFIFCNKDIVFFFVNDGSTDHTEVLLEELNYKYNHNVNVVHLKKNGGKGEAVRQGVNFANRNFSAKYIGYLDADLSTPLSEVLRICTFIEAHPDLVFVFGSRIAVFGSQIKRLSYRHYGGRCIATMIDMVLHLSIYDTQCGLKIFRKTIVHTLFEDSFINRWLFDVELFARMKILFAPKDLKILMKEIPVNQWTEIGTSKVRFMDILKVPFALLNINHRYRIQNVAKTSLFKPVSEKLPALKHNLANSEFIVL